MKLDRHLLLRASVLSMLFAGIWTLGCGAQSPEVPEDDDDNGGGTGPGVGGFSGTAGTPAQGGMSGSLPTGGASGTFPTTGGSAGTFPTTGGTAGTGLPTGGSGGSGTMCGTTMAAPGDTAIDNLEDGDNTISGPRVGYWYTYNDKSAGCMQTPMPDMGGLRPFIPATGQGSAGSIGARMNGGGCTAWGAGMGFDLANCNSKSGAYDASAFGGISFWYKSATPVRVMVGNLQNVPPNDANAPGGGCMDAADMCFNHHGQDLAAAPSGMTQSITFGTLSQAYGTMRGFLRNQIINIQFQVDQNSATYDVVVDDLVFTP